MNARNLTDATHADEQLIVGLTKRADSIESVTIGGVKLAIAQVIARVQARVDARKAATSTRASWQQAVHTDHELRVATGQWMDDLKHTLRSIYSGQIDALADFGLKPRKRGQTDPATRVEAAKKAEATRKARHTMGPKAKLEVRGDLHPVAQPPAPAAGTNGAPNGSPGTAK